MISPRENNWKLFQLCDVVACNTMNDLIRRQRKGCKYNNNNYMMKVEIRNS